jgi:hypothetical protein
MLEAFKKSSSSSGSVAPMGAAPGAPQSGVLPPESIIVRLGFDIKGAFLQAHTEQVDPVRADQVSGSGPVRQLLGRLEDIARSRDFVIPWGEPDETASERVYLGGHPELLHLLRQCPHVVDTSFRPLDFATTLEQISIEIKSVKGKPDVLHARPVLSQAQPVAAALSEHFVLAGQTIYEILPLGPRHDRLKDFDLTFPKAFINKYLSLLVSHLENVSIQYSDYQMRAAEAVQAHPVLLFDEIGQANDLHLRLGSALPEFDLDFFAQYDVNKIARVRDDDHLISVHEIKQDQAASIHGELIKTLLGYQKSLRQKNSLIIGDTGVTLTADLAKVVMAKELGGILAKFNVLGAKQLSKYHIHAATPKLQLSLSEGINYLEGDATLEIASQSFGVFDVLQLYKKHSYIPLSDGGKAILNPEYVAALARLFQKEPGGHVSVIL